MELDHKDIDLLEAMIDKYSLQSVLSALSYVCSEKAQHVAVSYQDTESALGWMSQSHQLDNLVARWERQV